MYLKQGIRHYVNSIYSWVVHYSSALLTFQIALQILHIKEKVQEEESSPLFIRVIHTMKEMNTFYLSQEMNNNGIAMSVYMFIGFSNGRPHRLQWLVLNVNFKWLSQER